MGNLRTVDNINNKSSYKKASILDILKIYGYIAKLSLKKQKRDYSKIDQEYNSGQWNKPFEEIDFESMWGIYGKKDRNKDFVMRYDGKLVKDKWHIFEEKTLEEFLEVLEKHKKDSIVEFGCGLGKNLFILRKAGFKKLEGYDLSENAIERARKYTKIKKYDIQFDVCDLNKSFPEYMIKGKIVFTMDCLEQCKHIMPNALRNIINGNPKLVINFEADYDTSPLMVRKYFDVIDCQNNLVQELKKLEKAEKIEILSIKRMLYSNSPVHMESIIIWKPKETESPFC